MSHYRVTRVWLVEANGAAAAILASKSLPHSDVSAERLPPLKHEQAIMPVTGAKVCLADGEPWPCLSAATGCL